MKGLVVMKLKKSVSALLAFFMLIPALTGCSNEKIQTDPYNPLIPVPPGTSQVSQTVSQSSTPTPQPSDSSVLAPAVWKVENSAGNYIYMMGTIHMGDDSVYNLPDYVNNAYDYSESLAVEADITSYLEDTSKAAALVSTMTYTDGTTIKDHISEETYNKAVERLESFGLYNAAYDKMMPFVWTSLLGNTIIGNTGLDIYKGVDVVFLKKAQQDQKPVNEIESVEMQFEIFNSYSDELNDLLIAQILDPNYGTYMVNVTKELYNRWKNGTIDSDLLISSNFVNNTTENYPLYQEYLEKLVYDRNKSMTKAVEQFVDSGSKVFFMVGVLHFVGDQGVVKLLQNDGYTVTRVTA